MKIAFFALLTQFVVFSFSAKAVSSPDDTFFHWQYYHSFLESVEAWKLAEGHEKTEVTVAVCDTGVKKDHEDLQGKVREGFNFVNGTEDTTPTNYHGTYLAGIIAANSNNSQGIAGFSKNAQILSLRVVDDQLQASMANVLRCIRYGADAGAKIVLVTIVDPLQRDLEQAGAYVRSKGGLLIMAAGNGNKFQSRSHNDSNILVVGASSQSGRRWVRSSGTGSNYGPFIDVMAPGHSILSTVFYGDNSAVNGKYQYVSTTAGSAAIVAGLASLVWSVAPDLSPLEVEAILKKTSTEMEDPVNFGSGQVNARRAVIQALDRNR